MHNVELENRVIGSMINDKLCLSHGLDSLPNEDVFISTSHREVFKILNLMDVQGSVIDPFTVQAKLQELKLYKHVESSWSDIVGAFPDILIFQEHCDILIENYKLSMLKRMLSEVDWQVGNSIDVVNYLNTELDKISNLDKGLDIITMGKVFRDIKQNVVDIASGKQANIGIPTGFQDFSRDYVFGEEELHIIAGRPSMGKSAFMIQLVKNLVKAKVPTGLISLEMSQKENAYRYLAGELDVSGNVIREGFFSHKDRDRFYHYVNQHAGLPLYLNEHSDMNLSALKAKIMYMSRVYGCKVVFIDWLGLIDLSRTMRSLKMNETQALGQLTRMLKLLARNLKITIVGLYQLNREVEKRFPPVPMLSDLRQSGSIEQDADRVLLLYRPEYYGGKNTVSPSGESLVGITEIIIAKNRNGKTRSYFFYTNLPKNIYEENQEMNHAV